MNAKARRPPDAEGNEASHGGLTISMNVDEALAHTTEDLTHTTEDEGAIDATQAKAAMLGSLPVGARLILRCRTDWRTATVAAVEAERVVLNVASPTGHTYRVRRPHDAVLSLDGNVPVLGDGCWRAGLARYDVRW